MVQGMLLALGITGQLSAPHGVHGGELGGGVGRQQVGGSCSRGGCGGRGHGGGAGGHHLCYGRGGGGQHAGHTKVSKLGDALGADEDVGGLHIAVHHGLWQGGEVLKCGGKIAQQGQQHHVAAHAAHVGVQGSSQGAVPTSNGGGLTAGQGSQDCGQGQSQAAGQGGQHGLLQLSGSAGGGTMDVVSQCAKQSKLLHDAGGAVGLVHLHVEHWHDVGVAQAAQYGRLDPEAPQHVSTGQSLGAPGGAHHLDRHVREGGTHSGAAALQAGVVHSAIGTHADQAGAHHLGGVALLLLVHLMGKCGTDLSHGRRQQPTSSTQWNSKGCLREGGAAGDGGGCGAGAGGGGHGGADGGGPAWQGGRGAAGAGSRAVHGDVAHLGQARQYNAGAGCLGNCQGSSPVHLHLHLSLCLLCLDGSCSSNHCSSVTDG
mmetsp:Transcript_14418/g.31203  ORF Transcript_14418/g.31203 Transcript_14418/m.31203 type:complete len:428 (+) Transcript_14418:2156-3439(+)